MEFWGIIDYKNQNWPAILLFFSVLIPSAAYSRNEKLFSCSHGTVIKSSDDIIKGAIVEEVSLFAQKRDSSNKTIVRKGMLVRRKNAKGTILMCHGFMCSKNDIGFLRQLFPDYNCLTFDFRAHGEERQGQYCTFGRDEALDVIAAAQFLKEHPSLSGKPLLVYAFSMGAVSAIEAQARDGNLFNGMILDCPFDSTETIIKRGLSNMRFSFLGYEIAIPGRTILEKYAFHPYVQSFVKMVLKAVAGLDTKHIETIIYPLHPVNSIKKVTTPCFFIHCRNDAKVGLNDVKAIFEGAQGHKELWVTNGRGHYDSFFYNPEGYMMRVQDFAKRVVKGELKKSHSSYVEEDKDDGCEVM